MPEPWERFKVGAPSDNPRWTNTACQPLKIVSHVAHLPTAYRIVEDQKLRADLVFDESILNTQRIRVVWLSPNDWTGAGGFRYGNVGFEFPWTSVIDGRKYFWVENMAYGIPACRILVANTDWSSLLSPYDPTCGDGPWWVDSEGNHHWNGNYCLEVMFEGDLELELSTQLSFVNHHPKFCSVDAYACRYRGARERTAGAEFLATLLSRHLSHQLAPILHTNSSGKKGLAGPVSVALNDLMHRCSQLVAPGPGITATDPQSKALARSLLGAMFRDTAEDRDHLASLFSCNRCLLEAVVEVIASGFAGDESDAVRQDLSEWIE